MVNQREELKRLRADFEKAVKNYRALIISNFYCAQGDERNGSLLEKKIIELFQKSSSAQPEFREALLFVLLNGLSVSVPAREAGLNDPNDAARRLTESLRDLAVELVIKLNK